MTMPDLRSFSREEMTAFAENLGLPAYRSLQIFRQAQKHGVRDFSEMSDLPLQLRAYLPEAATLSTPLEIRRQISRTGDTAKLLLEFADDTKIEMALMLYRRAKARDRATCCVSSQSGCAMGCSFCATALCSDLRNLTAGEIVAQVQAGDALARELGFDGVTNIVYMGMGEPLANMDNVHKSILLLNDEQGMDIGARRITVSTCGLVPKIYDMIGWKLQISLAVSLHAADEEKRRHMMPNAAKYSIKELIQACSDYRDETGRRVTCEYALFKNVNDSIEDAHLLADLLTERDILVNIIPANPVPERNIFPSEERTVGAFCSVLDQSGIPWQLRERRGGDIEAACGQLRRRG